MRIVGLRDSAKTDWLLIAATGFLVGLSTTILFAIEEGAANSVNFSPYKHVLHALLGITLAFVISRSSFAIWYRLSSWLYWASIVLLLVVLFANPTSGSSRWIELGFMQFQPSELAKFALILLLARLFSRRRGKMNKPFNIGLSIFYTALPSVLVLLQPDLGTAIVFVVIWFSMLVISDIKPLYLLAGFIVVAAIGALSVPFLQDYQKQRLLTFLDPAADPQGAGYNVRQASIAIGSGKLFGQGLDSGTQSQLNFLPAQHTDFIFAVTAEKLGLIGAMSVVIAYGVIVVRMLQHAARLKNSFAAHVCLGVAVLLAFHIIINIGMNLGLVPVTGLPLPFMSYGGTYLVITMVAVGVMLSTLRKQENLEFV